VKRTAIVFSSRYLAHNTKAGHPESPRRLEAIMEGIRQSGLLESGNCTLIEPRPAVLKELELVHDSGYISHVRDLSESGGGILDVETETMVSRESFEVAQLAAGGVIEAVDKVMARRFRNAFVLARPPSHHAGPGYALGFCIFNNAAIGAAHLLQNHSLNRVLILDIDTHHGNGTQEVFYGTDEVLYVSLHEDPTEFPQTGFIDETGEGQGLGYTVNIPFPFRTGDPAYWKAVKTIAVPIMRQFDPEFVLLSAGFDGYYRDYVGELSLSAHIYPKVFKTILDLAHRLCQDRLVAILEGGYRPWFLRKIVPVVIAKMAKFNIKIRDKRPSLDLNAEREAERVIQEARKIQSNFWTL